MLSPVKVLPDRPSMLTPPPDRQAPRCAFSSLEPEEINVREAPLALPSVAYDDARVLEDTFRHAAWQRHRSAITQAFKDLGVSPARIQRFQACGSAAWIVQDPDDPDHLAVLSSKCHDRFCLPCQTERSRALAVALVSHLDGRTLRFITLTIKHSDQPLANQLDHLGRHFRRLRATPLWRDHVDGGVAFIEVKRSRDRLTWHPHLHVIADGSYLPQSALAEAWHRVTRTSYVVDIRSASNTARVARYVTAYAAKPMSYATTSDPDSLADAITSLRGRHLWFTFGTWRAWKLRPKPEPLDWKPLKPLADVLAAANAGNPAALYLLTRLRRSIPCQATLNPDYRSHDPPRSPSSSKSPSESNPTAPAAASL